MKTSSKKKGATIKKAAAKAPKLSLQKNVSGLYVYFIGMPLPPSGGFSTSLNYANTPLPSVPLPAKVTPGMKPLKPPVLTFSYYREELRLDVDGNWPQMKASGYIYSLTHQIHWIANLKKKSANVFEGPIWYTNGSPALAFDSVTITVVVTKAGAPVQVIATFRNSSATRSMVLTYESGFFHQMEFEFDYEQGISALLDIGTHDHPNHPVTLPNEKLSIKTIFSRAGFDATLTGGTNAVPSSVAGGDTWSNNELHDAMQTYWSKFTNKPQWSLWTFFAHTHDMGPSLGGIMFDSIGPQHRQGTSIFYDSFISQKPPGDPQGDAFVARMKFWTAVHEMGHSFNLAHSWQKALGSPWISDVVNEPEARSFMNYPYNVSGGITEFFKNFEYRFSDQELLFMRHAPAQFVEMGAADWFVNHAFQWTGEGAKGLEFTIRIAKEQPNYEFMEPVTVELKLKNISKKSLSVSDKSLADLHDLLLVTRRFGDEPKQYRPYAQLCFNESQVKLAPGESIYETLFISAGLGEWYISEPGHYEIHACLRVGSAYLISNTLKIRVAPPRNYDESNVSQDYFSDDVGRILQFDGSQKLTVGNDVLREVVNKLDYTVAAKHASIALAAPLARRYKTLETDSKKVSKIEHATMKHKEANDLFRKAFKKDTEGGFAGTIKSLGNIDSKRYVETFGKSLKQGGHIDEAKKVLTDLNAVFAKEGVLPSVRSEVSASIKSL